MSDKKAVISMECVGGEADGVIWSEHEDGPLNDWKSVRIVGQRVVAYLEDLTDGETIELAFYRKDMTRAEYDAIPET